MKRHNLLVAIPVKDDLNPTLKRRASALLAALKKDGRNQSIFNIELAFYEDSGAPTPPDGGKWYHQARARNELIRAYLRPYHNYVLWIDADLTDYPADLPAALYEANPDGITAPLVLIEGTEQFYDTLGFIEHGRRANHARPYFHTNPDNRGLVNLDSVGCVYLMPSFLLDRVRYASLPYNPDEDHSTIARTGHTDHWPIMKAARAQGITVACLTTVTAVHADLPKYGENWH